MTARHLSAADAARRLGVSAATLYAYVSRGLVRSEEGAKGRRERRYLAEDIERLVEKKGARRDPAVAAKRALDWGAPVLESALTLIADGRLWYRGRDAIGLARAASVEEVAALLWTGDSAAAGELFTGSRRREPATRSREPLSPLERFELSLVLASARDVAAHDLRPAAVAACGARILSMLVAATAGEARGDGLAARLSAAWAPRNARAPRLVSAALVLCADHELNVSAFTARCVASAGATPYGVVLAGLAALAGAKHGGHTERVDSLLEEVGRPERAKSVLVARLKRGEAIPGLGHALYPEGDPRARCLFELATEATPRAKGLALARAVAEESFRLTGEHMTIDFGLAMLRRVLELPPGGGLALFALGRSIGWIAHAIEQYRLDRIIRPRARYTGPVPPESKPGV